VLDKISEDLLDTKGLLVEGKPFNALEKAQKLTDRISKTVSKLLELGDLVPGTIQDLVEQAHKILGKSRQDLAKQIINFEALRERQVQDILLAAPIGGGGRSAARLREIQARQLGRLNMGVFGPGYTIDPAYQNLMDMDPEGFRGPEIQLAQAKARRGMFQRLGNAATKKLTEKQDFLYDVGFSSEEVEKMTADLESLEKQYFEAATAADKFAESIEGVDASPLGSFAKGVTQTLSAWRAEMTNFTDIGKKFTENFASGMGTAFSNIVLGAKNAKEAFRDFALDFMKMATEMLMQKAVQMLLGSLLGGPVYATNFIGPVPQGAIYSKAGGGLISGTPSQTDNTLIYAATGEYVIPTRTVQKFGVNHFDQYLNGNMEKNFTSKVFYSDGGLIGGRGRPYSIPGQSGSISGSSSQQARVNVNVVVNNDKGTVTSQADAEAQSQFLAQGFQRAIQEELIRQQRQGGLFRQR